MPLKPARIRDLEFIAEVDRYKDDQKHFHLWWLGQSGYLLQWKGKRVILDPYLSDSLTLKYASTPKPHDRVSELVVDPSMLQDISVVTSSHNHTDHLDKETLLPILNHNPAAKFIIPEANREFVCNRLGVPRTFPLGLSDGQSLRVGEFTFHGIAAKHEEIERDEKGNCKYMGYVITFDGWSIYHSGDTLYYSGMEEVLRPFKISVALLPINGHDPSRDVAGNLDPKEAAELGKSIGAGVVIPCHYDMFAFNSADPEDFAKEARILGQPFEILQCGGHYVSH